MKAILADPAIKEALVSVSPTSRQNRSIILVFMMRQNMQTSGLRWRLALQCAVFPAQVVIALEKLCLRIKSRPTFGETARLAMQRRDMLTNRPVEPLQKRSRDLFERDQFFDAKYHPSGHRYQTPPRALFDNLPVTHSRIGHDL